MAEFVQTMKDWKRMCDTCFRCIDCPLEKCICPSRNEWNMDFTEAERIIEKWAAEHPVVYPTWGEWFLTTCQVPLTSDLRHNDWETLLGSPIPANIAQKLGIEPKEG